MLKQATKSFTATVLPRHTPVVKAMLTNEVSKVPNKQRPTEKTVTGAIFSERASSELGNIGVTQRQQTGNN
jgi:hypothetical protein